MFVLAEIMSCLFVSFWGGGEGRRRFFSATILNSRSNLCRRILSYIIFLDIFTHIYMYNISISLRGLNGKGGEGDNPLDRNPPLPVPSSIPPKNPETDINLSHHHNSKEMNFITIFGN